MKKKIITVILISMFILGCASTPEQFKKGDPIAPPKGCIEMRERGGKC